MKRSVQELGFVPKKPVGIACTASDRSRERVVLCRTNGSIEAWSANGVRPYVARTQCTPAVKEMTFRAVAFLDATRFVIGTLGGQLLIYRYATLELLEVVASLGGPVWSLDVDHASETVAIACEDARARFFHIVPESERVGAADSLVLIPRASTMVRPDSGRLLSIKFSTDGSKVYTSDDTGHVMCSQWRDGSTQWETDVTTVLQTLASQKHVKAVPKVPAVVWTLLEMEGYIICGTSTGEVKFLDPHTGVLLQSIKTHKADVLTTALVDTTVFVTGVDNILTTLNVWEGEWVKSEGRHWGVSDCTTLLALKEGVLLTGHLDGCLYACETRKMFPAKVATSRASLFHYYQPAFNHTFPYYKLAASASSRAVKKREKRTKLDEEVQRRMIACVDDFSVTLHCMPKSLNATRERAEEEREIVTELRYEVTGRFGVQAFDMDPLGRGFVFSTAERTCVVRIEYDGVTGKTAAVSVLPLWESREMTLPAATSLKLHPRSGALVLCHSGGVCVVRDVFSPADVPAARAAQVTALSNAPHSASGVGISQCGTCVVFAARAAGGAEGLLTAFKLFTEATTAPQKAGKRKRDDDTAPTTLTLCASPVQLLIKTTRKPVADVTACVVNGLPAAFVVLVDGSVAAFELASGKQVFGTSNMPHLSKGLAAPNRCDGSGDQVLLWNSVWYTVLNIGGPGYTECKSIESSSLKAERRGPAKTMLAVKRAPLQGGHIMNGGQTLLLAACSQEQYFSYAPSCFWRKQYAT